MHVARSVHSARSDKCTRGPRQPLAFAFCTHADRRVMQLANVKCNICTCCSPVYRPCMNFIDSCQSRTGNENKKKSITRRRINSRTMIRERPLIHFCFFIDIFGRLNFMESARRVTRLYELWRTPHGVCTFVCVLFFFVHSLSACLADGI